MNFFNSFFLPALFGYSPFPPSFSISRAINNDMSILLEKNLWPIICHLQRINHERKRGEKYEKKNCWWESINKVKMMGKKAFLISIKVIIDELHAQYMYDKDFRCTETIRICKCIAVLIDDRAFEIWMCAVLFRNFLEKHYEARKKTAFLVYSCFTSCRWIHFSVLLLACENHFAQNV